VRIVLSTDSGEVDVEVVVHDPTATVADLAAALPGAVAGGLAVDGVPQPGSARLAGSGVRPGCSVDLVSSQGAPMDRPQPRQARSVDVRVVGGLAAGDRHPQAEGSWTIGREGGCDVVLDARTTSRRHATITVTPTSVELRDDGSLAGTWVEGRRVTAVELAAPDLAALGAVLIAVAPPRWCEPAVLGRAGVDGRLSLHRPPPPLGAPAVPAVTPPADEPPASGPPRFGWAAALVPLVGGLVLAWLVDPRLALFTLLGPAVLVGQWIEERRRHRSAGVTSTGTERDRLASFAAALGVASAIEARRRRELCPDPAHLGEEIEAWGAGLWSARPDHPGFGAVLVGSAPAYRWEPPTTRAAEGPAAALVAESRLPPCSPVLASLGPDQHLGIAGPRPACLAVSRWVLLQLAARHGPADLRLAVVCATGRASDWDFTGFLPHTVAPSSPTGRLLAAGVTEAEEVAELLAAPCSGQVVVVDDAEDPAGNGLPASVVLAGGRASVTIAPSRRALPARCTAVLELDGPDGWGRFAARGLAPQALLATGVELATARRWARRLAGLADPELVDNGAGVPSSVGLLDLLDLPDLTAEAIRRRWSRAAGEGLRVPLGCGAGGAGPVTVDVDLVADGPHALVAGTTGAGKSELLRGLVAGLAATYPPDRLALLLIDFKGGAAFAEAAHLPHVVGVVTDLGPDEAARALRSLEAELRRRERVLADLGLRDVSDHPCHAGGPASPAVEPLPRVVVVIDELAALVAELPSFLDNLVQLAARGRSLGLHLILGTQRPGGVVSASVRANCALRCCLRVPDEADAVDVVGSTAPARIDRRLPGRAFVRRGATDLVEVQVGLVGGCRWRDRPPVTVVAATFGPDPAGGSTPAGPVTESDLSGLVEACLAAATQAGLVRPQGLWLPPLPADLHATSLPTGDDVVLGLLDDPDHQRRLPLTWRPADGVLLAVGSGAGPATALRAATRTLAAQLDPTRLHVYGFDLAGLGLAPLADLPHLGAFVRPGDPERLHRLIRRLADELAARQAETAPTADRPLVLVLVDGVAGLRSALDDVAGLAALDALSRVVADGAAVGMIVAASADRPGSVPASWSAASARRLAFRCGDPFDLLALGAERVDQSGWPLGRCLEVTSGLVAQVATAGWPAATVSGSGSGSGGGRAAPVLALPQEVQLAQLLADHPPHAGKAGLRLPIGIDGRDLGIVVLRLRPGQPFFVCGQPGSGRTTTLATLAGAAAAAGCPVLDAGPDLARQLAGRPPGQPAAVVVDDADRVEDLDGTLATLAAGRHPEVHLLAALPPDAGRAAFGHWTGELRRSGAGLLLRPRSDLDADVLGIALLPRWPMSLAVAGRGVLGVDGTAVPVQVARS